jgi:hypothetical protein
MFENGLLRFILCTFGFHDLYHNYKLYGRGYYCIWCELPKEDSYNILKFREEMKLLLKANNLPTCKK